MIRVEKRLWAGKDLTKWKLFKEGASDIALEKHQATAPAKLGARCTCMLQKVPGAHSLMSNKGDKSLH